MPKLQVSPSPSSSTPNTSPYTSPNPDPDPDPNPNPNPDPDPHASPNPNPYAAGAVRGSAAQPGEGGGWNLLTNLPNLLIKFLGCEPYLPTH